MNKLKRLTYITVATVSAAAMGSCETYLDEKPDSKLFVPTKVEDLQALLDNFLVMNQNDPPAAEMSCDNYYLTLQDWNNLSEDERRLYTWQDDYIFPSYPNQWSITYQVPFIANTALHNGTLLTEEEQQKEEWKNVRGQALFYRAKTFFHIATVWAPAYDPASSVTELGIPLRLTPDFNEPSIRANVEDTYRQIISDLKESVRLLPPLAITPMRPSKLAAYAMLARVYLSMRMYTEAGLYADSALQIDHTLLDYNALNPSASRPFERLNAEVMMHTFAGNLPSLSNNRAKIDSTLYRSFVENDLRKELFFNDNGNGTFGFKGTYSGGTGGFSGIANDEVYLIKAECLARAGKSEDAMHVLNELLVTRWKEGTFIPYEASDAGQALELVLTERRKQLIYRGLRWMDLKRLNKEGRNIELVREIGGTRYVLPPNDPRYALAIPEEIIRLSGIQQNPR